MHSTYRNKESCFSPLFWILGGRGIKVSYSEPRIVYNFVAINIREQSINVW